MSVAFTIDHRRPRTIVSALVGAFVLFALFGTAGTALAQSSLPSPAEPGHIQPPGGRPSVPSLRPEPAVEPPRRPSSAPANAENIRFVLRGLSINGVTVYDEQTFAPLVAPKIGTEISLADLYLIAEDITAHYGADGYILSQAIVPAQKIENGQAAIEVVEGKIDQVLFDGDVPENADLLNRIADRIRAETPLTAATLERYLLLMGDLAGYDVQGILAPSLSEGASDLIVEVRHTPRDWVTALNNRGTRYIGPLQAQLGAKFNNALGGHEGIGLSVATTGQPNELKSFGATFEQPLGDEGTKLTAALGQSYVAPGFSLKPRKIESEVTSLSLGLAHPVLRSRTRNLSADVSFDAKEISTTENDGRIDLSEDHLRSLRLGVRYDVLDTVVTPAYSVVSGRISQGIGLLGASDKGDALATRAAGNPSYTKLNLDVQRLQTVGEGINLLFGASGQYSFSKLLSAEEMSIGGEEYGRGFDPSEFAGDHGAAAKLELQLDGEAGSLPVTGVQYYGFADTGVIWNKDPGDGDSSRHALASVGGGIRVTVNERISGYLEIAKPVVNRVHSVNEDVGKRPRIFFGVVGTF